MGDTSGNGFTNKEILVRLEEKVDKVLDDHEKRLRGLEKFRWLAVGAGIVGGASAAKVAPLILFLAG